ncbi:hypothetical protein DICVIV_11627 [Dictyocaulus viviparus]|uniref:Uncharacterized protein n=1 Tax=Dictyocaulus viviparus TaxID=29172 RepID=A0A0D8XFA8_DICVI|nr:hypothetical protein DICVIV_11627 [Dictyocaulus viviparus]
MVGNPNCNVKLRLFCRTYMPAMNGNITNRYIWSQEGIAQSQLLSAYLQNFNDIYFKQNHNEICECHLKLWSDNFYTTTVVTFTLLVSGTLAIFYLWGRHIFEIKGPYTYSRMQ